MRGNRIRVDEKAAVDLLMRFLRVEGVTGQEEKIGLEVAQTLVDLGVPRPCICHDEAHKAIPLPTQTGNLIVNLPGTRPGKRILFMTHLDTVPLCAGARPLRKGKRIVPASKTALGGDNRTGVACLTTLVATLLRQGLPHPPLTLLFTVREESGLWGARFVRPKDLGDPEMSFNFDGRSPAELTIGAVGAERWQAEIHGRASHAGVHPERGISATLVAAAALADVHSNGWFGKISRDGFSGTSNVGSFGGADMRAAGEATNVVTDYVLVKGEARSHDARFVPQITAAYRDAFRAAAARIKDDRGRCARVRFQRRRDYYPFKLKEESPVVRRALEVATAVGMKPTLRVTNGGLDANWLVRHGIPTVTLGAGQNNPHTVEEFVQLDDFSTACRVAVALATHGQQ